MGKMEAIGGKGQRLVHLPHEPLKGTFQTEHARSRDWLWADRVDSYPLN